MFIKLHERRQEGFTLVELIIVLAIIGILTALAISRISYNRTRAAKTTCNGIMGDIKKATEAYYADTGERVFGYLGDAASTTSNLTSQHYMAGVPKQPHGTANLAAASTGGRYNIPDWAGNETATVNCAWDILEGAAGGPKYESFPNGHKL